MTDMPSVWFGKRLVGGGAAPLLLPDIDLFFNQDMALAEFMLSSLVAAGIEIVKGAVLHRAEIALDDGTEAAYFDGNQILHENYRALIARKVVSLAETDRLFAVARGAGIDFVLSVYDIEGAAFARDIGAVAIKIPSSNITHEPLIRFAAGLGLPLMIDTGKSSLDEIATAENWAREGGASALLIEHSPPAPPAPLSQHHLQMIPTLSRLFRVPIGLSDHHHGLEMMLAGAALGASVLEKGVVPDGADIDQDTFHAMRLSEVAGLLTAVSAIHAAIGDPMRRLSPARAKPIDRMGLVARRDLEPGVEISLETIDFAFPARGIGAELWSAVAGCRLIRAVRMGRPVSWNDIAYSGPTSGRAGHGK
ncbi:MAG TPA: N-acetylneuraminate synthase family protein [Kaistiaceae bacterium]|mgnify:CR=1 FL=1|nr:N-acetylneuraminate synthase family protein [Kaistiaceae bacterium]